MNTYRSRPIRIAVLTSAVGLASAATALGASHSKAKSPVYRATISKVTVSGTTVSVSGRVRLSGAATAARKATSVLVTLTDTARQSERRTVKAGSRLHYRTSWATNFQGRLTLTVRAMVAGKLRGTKATRTITVTPPVKPLAGGTPLIGTFKLDAGSAPANAAPTGSWFEMLQSNGAPLANLSSPAPNNAYTPLTPGTDGGLKTTAYQGPPSPAFAGGTWGGALANEIIQPVPFYLINFSVETSATDAQTGTADPLPSINNLNGTLNGQITAWDAQWNGQSFNQGTPKPNGTLPSPTTPLTGTYDASTHAFTLQWKSLIVGGPFNGFVGLWHLAGTFVPQPTTGTTLLPLPPL